MRGRLLRRKRNLTISEAAELTGLTRKAMARRVERGSVRSVLRAGRRLIPRSELVRVGLLPLEGESGVGFLMDPGAPQHSPVAHEISDEQSVVAVLVRELVDVLQRQAGELAQYKALTAEAESLRLEREVAELRVRLSVLEGGEGRRALEPGRSDEAMLTTQMPLEETDPRRRPSGDRLWLPPSATSARAVSTGEAVATGWGTRASSAGEQSRRPRLIPFIFEILFIGLVAFLAWLADLDPVLGAIAVGVAWLVAATFELVRWIGRYG